MPTITDEDYRSLELKIHTEVNRIFSQFMEDLESKTRENEESVPTKNQWKPGPSCKSVPGETTPAPARPRKLRGPRKSIDISTLLNSPSSVRKNLPGEILESDMNKIFRKKHQR
ncbi:hypothetical protein [Methanoregula sp.]|uniref:hypothetical protein n=1 Tax=Methanoregula sp. TaxID=2052170 RepID=UPI003565CDEB